MALHTHSLYNSVAIGNGPTYTLIIPSFALGSDSYSGDILQNVVQTFLNMVHDHEDMLQNIVQTCLNKVHDSADRRTCSGI